MIRSFARPIEIGTAIAVVCLASVAAPAPAAAEQAAKAYDFVHSIGVAAHLSRRTGVLDEAGWSKIRDAIADAGIRYVRTTINNGTGIGRARDFYASHGVRFNFTIDSRSVDGGNKKTTRLNPSRIGEMLAVTKEVGADAILSFEGANEYSVQATTGNSNWDVQLKDYQRQLYNTVKSDPEIADKLVLAPSIWRRKVDSYQKMGDLSDITDRGTLHKYHAGYMPTEKMDESIQDARIMTPNDPVFVTEYGYSVFTPEVNDPDVWYPITEYSQAKYLGRYLGELFIRPDVEKSFLYQIIDEKSLEEEPGDAKGLLRNDFSKRPGYFAYKNSIALLNDDDDNFAPGSLNFDLIGDLTDVHYFLVQKKDGTFFLVIWQEVESYDRNSRKDLYPADRPLRLSLNTPVGSVKTYLPTGLGPTGIDIFDPEDGRLPRCVVSGYAGCQNGIYPTTGPIDLLVPDELLFVEIRTGDIPPDDDPPDDPPDVVVVASAGASPVSGNAPLAVDFAGSADPAGSYTYSWDFGDGTGSTQRNPSHTYSSPGTYTAVLTVSDGTETSEDAVTVYALVAQDSKAPTVPKNLTAELASSNQIDFSWTPSTDDVGVARYVIYEDGQQMATSTGPSYSFSAKKGKWYDIGVSAVDAAGNESADSDSLKVYIYKNRLITR